MIEKVTTTHTEWFILGELVARKTNSNPQSLSIQAPKSIRHSSTYLININRILSQHKVSPVNGYTDSDGKFNLYIGNSSWSGIWTKVWTEEGNVGPVF